ncbi:MAG: head GIN domain-containing protein [Bacteroidota bacterium]
MKQLFYTFLLVSSSMIILQNTLHAQRDVMVKGDLISHDFDLEDFHSLSLFLKADVYLTQDSKQSVRIEAQEDLIRYLEHEVKDGKLYLDVDDRVRRYERIKIHISLPELRKISISGTSRVKTMNDFKDLDDVKVVITGHGKVKLTGSATNLQVAISGLGDVEVSEFEVASCDVSISGKGSCNVHASDYLDVGISGWGTVRYVGQPSINKGISGIGKVKKMK